jgi:hypothetical protein
VIYFIRSGTEGSIKVGKTADVQKRLASLQCGHPQKLFLLKSVPGYTEMEAKIHKDLKRWHSRGEWYHPTPEVLRYIEHCGLASYEIHEGVAFAVLYRENAKSRTEPCPFCGVGHIHGVPDGHRIAHCLAGCEEIHSVDGILLRRDKGYIVRTRNCMLPEKLSAPMTADCLDDRAKRGRRAKFERAMGHVKDIRLADQDEL